MYLEYTVKKNRTVDKWFSILVILLPFLYQYRGLISQISFGETILIPFMALFLVEDITKTAKPYRSEMIFYTVVVSTTLICSLLPYFSIGNALTVLVRLVYYGILMLLARKHFKWNVVKKFYEIAVVLFSIYLLLQVVYHNTSGGYLPIYLKYEWQMPIEARSMSLQTIYQWSFRPSSLFLESSYFAMFCMPYLCIKPFETHRFKEILQLSIVVVSIFLSTANSGVVAVVIVSIVYITYFLNKHGIAKWISYLVTIVIFILIIIWFMSAEFDVYGLSRLQTGGSFNNRITRGILIFGQLPIIHQFIGVGVNNIETFMKSENLSTVYDESNLNYMCSMLQIVICSGIFGGVSFIAYLKLLYNKIRFSTVAKCMFFIFLFTVCYEEVLFTYRFALVVIIMIAYVQDECNAVEGAGKRKGEI